MEDLVMGMGATYTLVIEWDLTDASVEHAYDYLTTFNRTMTNAEPCDDHGTGATCADIDTIAIPIDPIVTAGLDGITSTGDDITQVPGVFTLYGGTITSVSYTGTNVTGNGTAGNPYVHVGNSTREITIVYTSDQPNAMMSGPVLTWSGHIGTNSDWTDADPTGSPYHMRFSSWTCPTTGDCSTGHQDLGLATPEPEATAVTIGDVDIEVVDVDDYLDGIGVSGMETEELIAFLEVWDEKAAAELHGEGHMAILNAIINSIDPDGDGQLALFQWETLEQRGTVGFYAERKSDNGTWVRINGQLMPAIIPAPLGAQYVLADPGALPGESYLYRLVELEVWGTTKNYGPFSVRMP